MIGTISNAAVTVTTAGTRVAVTADTEACPASVYFEALHTNTGYIYVGLSDVSSTVYIARLAAGEGFSLTADQGRQPNAIQLSSMRVDSSVNGEKVNVTYQTFRAR